MLAETRVGPQVGGDNTQPAVRSDRTSAGVVTDAHGHFQEATIRSNIYSLLLVATTTGVAAGNITGAAAAASTQFAIWNPLNSGKALVLLKFGMGIISGTPGAGPMFHNFATIIPTIANTGTVINNMLGSGSASVAKFVASAAGVALTGGGALTAHSIIAFTSTNTAQASVGELNAVELIDGAIIAKRVRCPKCGIEWRGSMVMERNKGEPKRELREAQFRGKMTSREFFRGDRRPRK